VKMYLSSPSDTLAAGIKAGKVRLVGVSSATPSDLAPGAVPIAEVLPGFDVSVWYGVLGAKNTPAPVVDRLNKAFRDVLARPDIKARFHAYGVATAGSSPGAFEKIIAEEVPKWRATVESAHITAQ
jgi:tripartite-type tricarboxylate transporter receptor subunit TctC